MSLFKIGAAWFDSVMGEEEADVEVDVEQFVVVESDEEEQSGGESGECNWWVVPVPVPVVNSSNKLIDSVAIIMFSFAESSRLLNSLYRS